jgi:hypothetical protein
MIQSLANALTDWEIQISDAGLTTLLFQVKKYDIAHFFMPASRSSSIRFARKGPKTKIIQTLTSGAENPAEYKNLIFGDSAVTFCDSDKKAIQTQHSGISVETILPCSPQPAAPLLQSAAQLRAKFDVEERLLVVSLSDFSDHSHFSAFLYTAREYQRRDGFRFLLPLYNKDKESLRWRDSLKAIVEQEKLTRTTFVDGSIDLHSLIDSADFCLHICRERKGNFEFPLVVAEALCAGKPVVCFNTLPLNEFIASFKPEWIVNVNEDYSRISRDLLKLSSQLEQISTDLARFARSQLSVESVSARYKQLYKSLLSL